MSERNGEAGHDAPDGAPDNGALDNGAPDNGEPAAGKDGGRDPHPTILATLREMDATVRILVLGNLISNLAAFLNAFLVLFLSHRGFSAWESGVVLGGLMVGRILGSAVGGAAADRFGYRAVVIGSMAGTAAFTAGIVLVPNMWLGVLVAGAAGLTAQAYRPASQAWVVELTPPDRHVMVFSVLRLTFNVGATVGPLGAALLLTYASYEALFYVDAATSLAFGVVAYLVLKPEQGKQAGVVTTDGGTSGAAGEHKRADYRQVLADKRFMLVVLGLFLTAIAYIQSSAALPLYVTGSGHTEQTYALLLTINGFIVIGFEVLLSKWLQRLPIGLPMAIGMAMLGIGHLLYAGPTPLTMLIFATVVWTFGEIVAAPSMMAYPGLIAPPHLRGRYIAAATVPQQAGYAIGPVLGIPAWHYLGSSMWLATAACGLIAAALVMVGADVRKQPPADAAPAAETGTKTETEAGTKTRTETGTTTEAETGTEPEKSTA